MPRIRSMFIALLSLVLLETLFLWIYTLHTPEYIALSTDYRGPNGKSQVGSHSYGLYASQSRIGLIYHSEVAGFLEPGDLPFPLKPTRFLWEHSDIRVSQSPRQAHVTLRWRGGALTDLDVPLRCYKTSTIRTDEDTVELIRRLAAHYSDATLAGILNRQGRKTAREERFTANHVGNLRRYRDIPRHEPTKAPPEGELLTVADAAEALGVAASTIHRWLPAVSDTLAWQPRHRRTTDDRFGKRYGSLTVPHFGQMNPPGQRSAAQAASLGKIRWNSGRVVGKPRGSMARK